MIQSIIGRIWVKFSLLRLPLILWFLFSGVWYGVYAQDSGQGIFSPFVSQLTAEVRNNLVRLSWTDSRDARGPVYIFRSVRPFDPNGVAGIRPIVIPYGTQYYVDETEGEGEGYYFVAASDTNGQRYDIIIPFTNTVSAGTAEFPWNDSNTPAAASRQNPWSPQSQAPDISGLNVYADGGRAIISFTASGSAGKTVLYRNTQPIRRIQDLLSAVIVQTDGNSPLMDFPIPGTYYYAVFFQDDITKGTVAIKPGQNTTLNPVAIAGVNPPAPPEIRAMPLPVMNVPAPEDKAPAQQPNPAPQFLQTPQVAQAPQDMQTVQIAQTPQNSPAAQTQKRPRVFARDLLAPSGGEESTLRTIVQGPITRREWTDAVEQLQQYLSLPRSAATEARARYYLGQSYYYSGQNREALVEFLSVQDSYPAEAAEWIQTVLATMAD